jgi:hypothetical protein
VLLFIRTQKTSAFSLICAITGTDDGATSTRQISTPSTSSTRARVRMTAVCQRGDEMRREPVHEAVHVECAQTELRNAPMWFA